jgi:hypothetical protein
MGFNGEIIVVRSQANPQDLGRFIGTEDHQVRGDWPLSSGWRAIHVRPWAEPFEYDAEWLAEVSATSGAPVLACWVFESDVAHIRGLSSVGTWDCWLNLPYAASMLADQALDEVAPALSDEGGPDVFDRYRSERLAEESARLTREIPLAAQQAAAWAAQAGYTVRAEPIEELLRAPREQFVQWGFFKLLYRLGLTDTDFDPEAED